MAYLGFQLDTEAAAEEYQSDFKVIAPGWYQVVIIKSEMKTTKNGSGKILVFEYQTKAGDKITDRLNIINQSEVAQQIGRSTLGKIAVSIGHGGALANTDDLHGRPFDVKVAVEEFKSNKSGKMLKSNKISDYRKCGTDTGASKPAAANGGGGLSW